ncbi:CCN family member 1-like [Stegostoma tigrinum]|uniref:CCN family member 1-like n=1 Tax=Stegostoma tigrinum TaxID=3053191 RepID=UPI00202B2D78|nr:CCN family member 1-like [Stegostoma tigrinum]
MEGLLFFSLLLSVASALLSKVRVQCPSECSCPPSPVRCPPGVSLVLDGCGCCKVCAQQLNDDCSLANPCDHLKGLECNQGTKMLAGGGICRAKSEGRTCEYNGRIYQHGEGFQLSCKHQCTCIDGAVGCIPLCPQELPLTGMSCLNPRLVKVPGQCCEKFVCDKEESKHRGVAFHDLGYLAGISSNELVQRKHHSLRNRPAWRALFEGQRFPQYKCIVQTTQWSECSKICGLGVSTRVSNDNPECKLKKETRLCQVRSCRQTFYPKLKKGKKCTRTQKAMEPVRFNYAGCKSVKQYRPNSCGLCIDQRCCSPQKTRTIRVQFSCEDGESFSKNMMMIQSCKCSYSCPHLNEVVQPSFRLNNDIHKFLD